MKQLKKLFFLLTICTSAFAFDTKDVILERIENNFDTSNAGISVQVEPQGFIFKTAKGSAVITFENNRIDKIIVNQKYRNPKTDAPFLEGLMKNVAYFTGEPELENARLSDATSREYEMQINTRLSGKGVATKIIDYIIFKDKWQALFGNYNRERNVEIKIYRK